MQWARACTGTAGSQGGAGEWERGEGEGVRLLVVEPSEIDSGGDGVGLDLCAGGVQEGIGLGGDGDQAGQGYIRARR